MQRSSSHSHTYHVLHQSLTHPAAGQLHSILNSTFNNSKQIHSHRATTRAATVSALKFSTHLAVKMKKTRKIASSLTHTHTTHIENRNQKQQPNFANRICCSTMHRDGVCCFAMHCNQICCFATHHDRICSHRLQINSSKLHPTRQATRTQIQLSKFEASTIYIYL